MESRNRPMHTQTTGFLQRRQGRSVEKRYCSTIGAGTIGYPNAKHACGPQLLPYVQTQKES